MSGEGPLQERGRQVAALASIIGDSRAVLANVSSKLCELLDLESWRQFTGLREELIEHDNFDEFASDDPPRGLGASLSLLRALTVEDETAANRLERELSDSARSMPVPVDDGEMRPRSSPAQVAALRRLRKDAPALHARVLTGEMSAHAAMVQAGFRARTISVPVSRPESAAKALRNKLTREEIAELVALLSQDL